MTHYQTLSVAPNASSEEIKSVFRRLAMQHHPDKGGDPKIFSAIQIAYTVLSDPVKRREYNESLTKRPVNDLKELATSLSSAFCNS